MAEGPGPGFLVSERYLAKAEEEASPGQGRLAGAGQAAEAEAGDLGPARLAGAEQGGVAAGEDQGPGRLSGQRARRRPEAGAEGGPARARPPGWQWREQRRAEAGVGVGHRRVHSSGAAAAGLRPFAGYSARLEAEEAAAGCLDAGGQMGRARQVAGVEGGPRWAARGGAVGEVEEARSAKRGWARSPWCRVAEGAAAAAR